ncbi:MAG: YezD family protein [Paenibacillaceae bacterium]
MSDVELYNDLWLERIKNNIQGLKFGTVQITIHEGKIVQIDRTERSRFDSLESNGSQAKSKTKPRTKRRI